MTCRTGPARRAGLSLLEVLLALAIFLMSLAAIGRLVDLGTDSALDAATHSDGTRLAQSKLAEVEAGVISVSGNASGAFDDEPEWTWTVESAPTEFANLYAVTVRVSRDIKGAPRAVTLVQMVFDPARMGTAAPIPKPEAADTTGTTGTSP